MVDEVGIQRADWGPGAGMVWTQVGVCIICLAFIGALKVGVGPDS